MMYASGSVPVREVTTMQQRKTTRGGSQGQPNVHSTRMHRTANGTRHPNDIRMPVMSGEDTPDAVPLFLVPRAVADEIRRHGRAVREINVRRTRNHQYSINVERGRP